MPNRTSDMLVRLQRNKAIETKSDRERAIEAYVAYMMNQVNIDGRKDADSLKKKFEDAARSRFMAAAS